MTIAIVTHPDNKGEINNAIRMAALELQMGISLKDMHLPKGLHNFPVYYDTDMTVKRPTGKWLRLDVLSDDNATTWIDDMDDPPSWAIYFGLVEEEYEYNYQLIDTATVSQQDIGKQDLQDIMVGNALFYGRNE